MQDVPTRHVTGVRRQLPRLFEQQVLLVLAMPNDNGWRVQNLKAVALPQVLVHRLLPQLSFDEVLVQLTGNIGFVLHLRPRAASFVVFKQLRARVVRLGEEVTRSDGGYLVADSLQGHLLVHFLNHRVLSALFYDYVPKRAFVSSTLQADDLGGTDPSRTSPDGTGLRHLMAHERLSLQTDGEVRVHVPHSLYRVVVSNSHLGLVSISKDGRLPLSKLDVALSQRVVVLIRYLRVLLGRHRKPLIRKFLG